MRGDPAADSAALCNFIITFGKQLPLRKASPFGDREMIRLMLASKRRHHSACHTPRLPRRRRSHRRRKRTLGLRPHRRDERTKTVGCRLTTRRMPCPTERFCIEYALLEIQEAMWSCSSATPAKRRLRPRAAASCLMLVR
jgi:hypothetical protein